MTVRKKVLLALAGFSLIPMLILTVIGTGANISNINALYNDRIDTLAHISASALGEIVDLYKNEIYLFSKDPYVKNFVESNTESDPNVVGIYYDTESIRGYIREYVELVGKFDNIVLIGKDGHAIISYQAGVTGMDLGEMDYFVKAVDATNRNYVHISTVHPSLVSPEDPRANCIGISTALYSDEGVFQGVVVAFANTRELGAFAQNIRFGDTGIAFVTDSEDFILYHPEARFLNTKTAAPKIRDIVKRYRSGQAAPSGRIVDNMGGIKRIYHYVIVEQDGLALFLRQDYSETALNYLKSITIAVVMLTVTALSAIFLGSKLSVSFVGPILKIKEAFDASRLERKYVRCEISSNDEFGDMAAGYNDMIQTLETQFRLVQSEKRKTEYAALHDSVTDLNNRFGFESEVAKLIRESNEPFGVLFLDMDGFKQINDVLGHAFGDMLLYMIGRRIQSSAAGFDFCARIGGDEFAIVKSGSRLDVRAAADILHEEIRSPFKIEMHTLHITTSMGAAMYPENGVTVETLIKNADIAMYYSKDGGKNMFSFFTDEMQNRVNRQSQIMNVLRKSIERDEIYLVFQPEVSVQTGKTVAYEALLRIDNQEIGPLSPAEFIPVAESSNALISNIGHWTLENACRLARRMVEQYGFDGSVAVNISVVQLRCDNFVDEVLDVLKSVGLDSRHLQIELTESILMSDIESNAKKLATLREHGISIAMDDFGTHYSSFNYLLNLPLDVLKIDRSFFREIETNDRMRYISEAIVDVAHKLKLTVVAEGVENLKQRDLISKIGCDVMQGFYYSRPILGDDVPEWHRLHN